MRIAALLLAVSILLTGGCNARPAMETDKPKVAELVMLYKDGNCNQASGVQWIERQQDLDTLYQSLQSHIVSPAATRAPAVDFSQNGVLLVSMGSRRTGGYGISLASEQIQIQQGLATVFVRQHKPKPGMMLTQALSSPCLLLRAPLTGYRQIVVVDQHGRQQGLVELHAK